MEYTLENMIEKLNELIHLASEIVVNYKADGPLTAAGVLSGIGYVGYRRGCAQRAVSRNMKTFRDGMEVLGFMITHTEGMDHDLPFPTVGEEISVKDIEEIKQALKKYRELLEWRSDRT